MDEYLLKEKSSAYRNLVKTEDALPIYDCLHKRDYAEIVKASRDVLMRTARMPVVPKQAKSNEKSKKFREEGNKAFALNQYQNALVLFNKALCYAENESRNVKLAYADRSALFQKIKAYGEATIDIDICMLMGCPTEIQDKLKARHRLCREIGWIKKLSEDAIPDTHSLGKFFVLPTLNPQLHTASREVGIAVTENNKKVVAAKDINVGSLLVIESAYVSQTNDSHKYLACSFCHKLALNLIPCRNCCDTLFCGTVCLNLAVKEYHEIECHLSEVLRNTSTECRMALKAVIRMTLMCDWDTLIRQSKVFGKERVIASPLLDVFSETYPFTILCTQTEKPFVHGTMYNAAIDCAVVLYYLDKLQLFLPSEEQKRKDAVDAIARIMMYLSVYHAHTQMQVVIGQRGEDPKPHKAHNFGWFPLISKIKNSCVPNVIAMALNKEVALIAVQPIKIGTELTMAYLGHWLDNPMSPRERQKVMFALSGTLCQCQLCLTGLPRGEYILTEKQLKNWRRLDIETMKKRITGDRVDIYFERLCKALTMFSDKPFSVEYAAIFDVFCRCLRYYQAARYPQRLVNNYED